MDYCLECGEPEENCQCPSLETDTITGTDFNQFDDVRDYSIESDI